MNIKNAGQDQSLLPRQQLASVWADDPMKIVVMLFDKSLLHISRAKATLAGWSDDRYQTNILLAVDVIEQLQKTLDLDSQGAMASNLDDLYRYIMRILISSINDQNTEQLTHASTLLWQIRESLSVLVKKSPTMLQH